MYDMTFFRVDDEYNDRHFYVKATLIDTDDTERLREEAQLWAEDNLFISHGKVTFKSGTQRPEAGEDLKYYAFREDSNRNKYHLWIPSRIHDEFLMEWIEDRRDLEDAPWLTLRHLLYGPPVRQ